MTDPKFTHSSLCRGGHECRCPHIECTHGSDCHIHPHIGQIHNFDIPETEPPQPDPLTSRRINLHVERAMDALRTALLIQANHEILRVNAALHEAGIEDPQGAAGVRNLANLYRTATHGLIEAMQAEVDDEAKRPGTGHPSPTYSGMRFMLDFAKKWTGYDE